MREPDAETLLEWLHLEMDGELTAGERGRLERWLAERPELGRERRQLAGLDRLLREDRVALPPGSTARVVAALPAAGWESRHPRTWWAAALLMAALLAGAVGLGGLAAAGSPPLLGAAAAVVGLLGASLAAGLGVLGASWQGLGLALSGALGASVLNWAAFAAVVLGLDLLMLRLLRRPAPGRARR